MSLVVNYFFEIGLSRDFLKVFSLSFLLLVLRLVAVFEFGLVDFIEDLGVALMGVDY